MVKSVEQMSPGYRLLVFDWDGTLMDSSEKIVNCFNGSAQDLGVNLPDAGEVKSYIGLSLSVAFARLYPHASAGLLTDLIARYREHWLVHDRTEMKLFPGVESGIRDLTANGYELAVATGKSRRGLDRALGETGLEKYFLYTRCADQARSKPDPQMLHDVLEFTGMTSDETVMIGDTTFDLLMAKNAGVRGWGVGYGSHASEELQALSFHPVAEDFHQLLGGLLKGR